MQPGRAQTSSLGVPPLLLAVWVGWVAQLRPTHGVWFVVTCPSANLGAHVCALSMALWRSFTGVRTRFLLCAVFLAAWRLFTLGSAWCVVCTVFWTSWRLITAVCASCVACAVFLASLRLFISAAARFVLCAVSVATRVSALGVSCLRCP